MRCHSLGKYTRCKYKYAKIKNIEYRNYLQSIPLSFEQEQYDPGEALLPSPKHSQAMQ